MPEPQETHPTPNTLPHPLFSTLSISLGVSRHFATLARTTPENRAYLHALDTLTSRLDSRQTFTPSELDVLRRSLTSTQALVEMGTRYRCGLSLSELDRALDAVNRWSQGAVRPALRA